MLPLSPFGLLTSARTVSGSDADVDQNATRSLWADDPSRSTLSSAAFVNHVGYWSQGGNDISSAWPFPLDANCTEMYRIALRHAVLRREETSPGMIYLKWNEERQRFVRAGILVRSVKVELGGTRYLHKVVGIEGKATVTPVGDGRFRTKVVWARPVSEWIIPDDGDRLIDWVALDNRAKSVVEPRRTPRRRSPYRSSVSSWRWRVG